MELRDQRGLDAGAGLVVSPKPIAKRLDHVVGGDAEVSVPVLDHLEHGLQHADDGAVSAILAFVEPAQAVEVTEEFVSAVDEVNDHCGSRFLSVVPWLAVALSGVAVRGKSRRTCASSLGTKSQGVQGIRRRSLRESVVV